MDDSGGYLLSPRLCYSERPNGEVTVEESILPYPLPVQSSSHQKSLKFCGEAFGSLNLLGASACSRNAKSHRGGPLPDALAQAFNVLDMDEVEGGETSDEESAFVQRRGRESVNSSERHEYPCYHAEDIIRIRSGLNQSPIPAKGHRIQRFEAPSLPHLLEDGSSEVPSASPVDVKEASQPVSRASEDLPTPLELPTCRKRKAESASPERWMASRSTWDDDRQSSPVPPRPSRPRQRQLSAPRADERRSRR